MIKVLLTDSLSQKAVELLKEIPEFEIVVKSGMNPGELKEEIKNYDAVVVNGSTVLSREIIEGAQSLKIIVHAGIGWDNIDREAAAERKIALKDTPLATTITVAEFTMAQMLAVSRYIGPAYSSMKAHNWEHSRYFGGIELYGKTAGIIGMGRIGKELAVRELAMGMKVLFYDIADIHVDFDARQVPLDELLRKSDFISVHLPLTDLTRNIISTEAFKKMKNGVVFVNVSSGGVVDETAMMKTLDKNKIRALAVDVFEKEPTENVHLIDHPCVFPSPHLGASTVEAQERAGVEAISILKEFFNA